jgi:hypothetical protein
MVKQIASHFFTDQCAIRPAETSHLKKKKRTEKSIMASGNEKKVFI